VKDHAHDVDAPPITWREAGPDQATADTPVAVLLHGLGGSRIGWEPQLAALSTTHRVIAWEAPGYGGSDPVASCTFDAYVDALAGLLDTVSPDAPVDLVGMSFGGMIAQYAAARFPQRIRTLTLLCTSPKFGLDGTDPDEWRAHRLSGLEAAGSPSAVAPAILGSLVGAGNEHVVPEAIAAMDRVPLRGLLDSLSTIVSHDSRAILPTIEIPTLVLVGSIDEETPPAYGQAIVDLMPNARLCVIDDAGHLLNLEAAEAVSIEIAGHWQEERHWQEEQRTENP
jgi:3-oxoadipate enol-lactonase